MPDEQIRPIAERLSKQRPWLSAEQNWFAAVRALQQKPWRPWVIHFSGEKERSGWDWADLLLKVSIPVLILGLSTAYSIVSSQRQEKIAEAEKERQEIIAQNQRESDVLTTYFKQVQVLMLDYKLKTSPPNAEVSGVARALTLSALSQVKTPAGKRLIISFLLDSGLNKQSGSLFSLDEANLVEADLRGLNLEGVKLRNANLRGAMLFRANLRRSDLRDASLVYANLQEARLSNADLRRSDLFDATLWFADLRLASLKDALIMKAHLQRSNLDGADLSGVDLRDTYLAGANLQNIKWDYSTVWPAKRYFQNEYVKLPWKLKKRMEEQYALWGDHPPFD